jgi:serine/threonine protein kinase
MTSPQLRSENFYKIEKFINAGAFGGICKISINEDSKIYALKQINLLNFSEEQRKDVLIDSKNEYKLLRKGIPNVLRSYGSHYDQGEQVFKFSADFMEMNLTQLVEKKNSLTFSEFIPIFRDIISGCKLYAHLKIDKELIIYIFLRRSGSLS